MKVGAYPIDAQIFCSFDIEVCRVPSNCYGTTKTAVHLPAQAAVAMGIWRWRVTQQLELYCLAMAGPKQLDRLRHVLQEKVELKL